MIETIKQKGFDLDYFTNLALTDNKVRLSIINYMLNSSDIMEYYHCFYIIDRASKVNPAMFYSFWDEMSKLLSHKNSYHRNFGLILIANVISVDTNKKFDKIFDSYLACLSDQKFMSAECCVKNLERILRVRNDLIDSVIDILLSPKILTNYTVKQNELLKYHILKLIVSVYSQAFNKEKLNKFIIECSKSSSPKTSKYAKQLGI